MWRSGSRITAPAVTGPARHPRPTSSAPATRQKPTRRNAFSSVRVAETRDMDAGLVSSCGSLRLARRILHARCLALQRAQVVQLGASDLGGAHHLDLLNDWRVQRENALDA